MLREYPNNVTFHDRGFIEQLGGYFLDSVAIGHELRLPRDAWRTFYLCELIHRGVADLTLHRLAMKSSVRSATGGGRRSGGAWPLGRRSAVRAEQQLHRDLGRASYALRDVGQGGRQGHPDGSLGAHQAGEEATKGTVQVPDLGSGKGTYGSSSPYAGDQNRPPFLRTAKPVAARVLSGSTSQQIRRQNGLLVKYRRHFLGMSLR